MMIKEEWLYWLWNSCMFHVVYLILEAVSLLSPCYKVRAKIPPGGDVGIGEEDVCQPCGTMAHSECWLTVAPGSSWASVSSFVKWWQQLLPLKVSWFVKIKSILSSFIQSTHWLRVDDLGALQVPGIGSLDQYLFPSHLFPHELHKMVRNSPSCPVSVTWWLSTDPQTRRSWFDS